VTAISAFVPEDFAVPTTLAGDGLRLTPLGPEHSAADFAAWTSSIEHIRATPGFEGRDWPAPGMSLAENTADLRRHQDDFRARQGFAYTVQRPADEVVIGCVYVYPTTRPGHDAEVRSWVRAADAGLDRVLYDLVNGWVAADWPFASPYYAPR
jgi:hypothetical protein